MEYYSKLFNIFFSAFYIRNDIQGSAKIAAFMLGMLAGINCCILLAFILRVFPPFFLKKNILYGVVFLLIISMNVFIYFTYNFFCIKNEFLLIRINAYKRLISLLLVCSMYVFTFFLSVKVLSFLL